MPAIRKVAKKQSAIRKHTLKVPTEVTDFLHSYEYPLNVQAIRFAELHKHYQALLKKFDEYNIAFYYVGDVKPFPKAHRLIKIHNQRFLKEIYRSSAWKKEIKRWQHGWAFDPKISKEKLFFSAPQERIEKALKAFFSDLANTIFGFWSVATLSVSGKVATVHVWETEDIEQFLETLFTQNTHQQKRNSPSLSATLFAIGVVALGSDRKLYRVASFGKSRRWVLVSEDVE